MRPTFHMDIGGDIVRFYHNISSNKSRKWYWTTLILNYWKSCIGGPLETAPSSPSRTAKYSFPSSMQYWSAPGPALHETLMPSRACHQFGQSSSAVSLTNLNTHSPKVKWMNSCTHSDAIAQQSSSPESTHVLQAQAGRLVGKHKHPHDSDACASRGGYRAATSPATARRGNEVPNHWVARAPIRISVMRWIGVVTNTESHIKFHNKDQRETGIWRGDRETEP